MQLHLPVFRLLVWVNSWFGFLLAALNDSAPAKLVWGVYSLKID